MQFRTAGIVLFALVAYSITVEGGQRQLPGSGKKQVWHSQRVTNRAEPIVRPRASIGGGSNGVYCSEQWDNGIAVHDLGFVPAGRNVSVTVESYSEGFNPVAAVLVASIGQAAGNTIKTTTFYDDDSGGEGDALVSFVAPQAGTYLLMVNDLTDTTVGCYRYQVVIG